MFTDGTQAIVDAAKDIAHSSGSTELTLSSLLAAMTQDIEASTLLAECLNLTAQDITERIILPETITSCPGTLRVSEEMHAILIYARECAQQVPDSIRPGLVNQRHLVCAVALSPEACAEIGVSPLARAKTLEQLTTWSRQDHQLPDLGELVDRLHEMRDTLLKRVFGQDHAVHAFVEALFNAEVVAGADKNRKRPKALFAFAGPPGVGKTYLAELGASYLDRPFKRFDMSSYSSGLDHQLLTGMAKGYAGARTGTLTGFILKNPNAVLLFDEIEKASSQTIHLFLQLLDAGVLQDTYLEQDVAFSETIIILTTNAGRMLYDNPNESGVHTANSAFHRKTILDALENEKDPKTGQPFFPGAICSRMATGYPVLFNHLRVNELEKVVRAELKRVGGLFEKQYFKRIIFDDLTAMCLVLREGAQTDARTLRSQAEAYVKTQIFQLCQLYESHRIEDVMDKIDYIKFGLDGEISKLEPNIRTLFAAGERAHVLLVADDYFSDLYQKHIDEVEWYCVGSAQEAFQLLAEQEIDMVLLDIWLGRDEQAGGMTIENFDHTPLAARALDKGQELLRQFHERLPNMPVFLLSFPHQRGPRGQRKAVDDELLMACIKGGGARGMIVSRFTNDQTNGWERARDDLSEALKESCECLYRERAADKMGMERKVIAFDTVPRVDDKTKTVKMRIRNLHLTRAISAVDAGELVDEVERPRTRFSDVIGADAAKNELQLFIDYLRNPKRFAAMDLKPPKGVVLYGKPGTGKTMLARAIAGESDVAFLQTNGSSFVRSLVGSGPQNVRDLFVRARRYAPSIVFIDEIDVIGKMRTGTEFAGRSEENTLNALLTELDGFVGPSPERPVFVLAATNYDVKRDPNDNRTSGRILDDALTRRLKPIKVELPDRPARETYLKMRVTASKACDVSNNAVNMLAERSYGKSLADLQRVFETAAHIAMKADGIITDKILENAFETVLFGEATNWNPEEVERTARHEAGHTIIYWLSGRWPSYVTIVARDQHGGYMAPGAADSEKNINTREELLTNIRVSLGGRAAETIYYGVEGGQSTGAGGDLEHAKNVAKVMMTCGMCIEECGLSGTSPNQSVIEKIFKEQMDKAIQQLQENRIYLDKVSEALLDKERLTAEELKQILPRFMGTEDPSISF